LGAAAILLAALHADAQDPNRRARIAVLSPFSSPDPGIEIFRAELGRLGWIEGRNLTTEVALANGQLERLPELAATLAARKPEVIFAPGEQGLAAVKKAGGEIPIVTVACDPLDRLVASLAAPGGRATGLSCIHSELAGKRLEILKELLPDLERAAVIYNPSDPNKRLEFDQLRKAGEQLGVRLREFGVADGSAISDAFATMRNEQAQAVIVLVDAFTIFHRQMLASSARQGGLPSMFGFKEFVEAGGLISYGASRSVLFKRAASYVDRILKGAAPGELPVEEPTTFELYINKKTATALAIRIPPALLARSDEVIE
jgi:putative ABC transport system substrate-binding protein